MLRASIVFAVAAVVAGACDDSTSGPPLCSTTFTDGSEHSAAAYQRGCVDDDGNTVIFTRYQCESTVRPDLYHAEGLGSGRPKGSGVFRTEGTDGRPSFQVVDYCPGADSDGG